MLQEYGPKKGTKQAWNQNVKCERRNLKPSSLLQDGKNRGGTDLKRKMKKSRSTKLSDIESLRSSPSSSLSTLRKNISQPGKPPTLNVQKIAATSGAPQKQPLTKTTDGSPPNYMKPTSCSDARREQSQVSVRNSSVRFSDSKNQNRRSSSNSNLSSGSNNITSRASSLKLVRTLMKSPSFKPARASAKRTSRVALYEDANLQRATCSSTLKESKFPNYLMISPGGTEAEGTSVMKVCPYTYCSLNGHHHAPVTPLKCFLSARRRSLKTQKMVKLQARSPRSPKPCTELLRETDFKQMFDDNEQTAMKEVGIDYFVEIYAKTKEHGAQTVFTNIPEAEIINSCPEEQKEVANEDYQPLSDQEETGMTSCLSESEADGFSSIEVDYAHSEVTDFEWEEGQFSCPVLDDDEQSSSTTGPASIQDGDVHEEPVMKSDSIVSSCNDMNHDYYEVLQELFEEKIPSFEIQLNSDGAKQEFGIQVSERLSYDQFSYTEEDTFEENSELSETDFIEISSSATKEPVQDQKATGEEMQEQTRHFEGEDREIDSHFGEGERNCITASETNEEHNGIVPSAPDNQPRNEYQDEGMAMSTSNLSSNANQDISKTVEAETNEENNGIPEIVNSETDQNVVTIVSGIQMEEMEKADDTKSTAEVEIADSAHTTSVGYEDCNEAGDNEDTAEDDSSGQDIVDEIIFGETRDDLANKEYKNNDSEDHISLEKDQSDSKKPKISKSTGNEDQYAKLKRGLARNCMEDTMEVDNNSDPHAAETFLIANNSISPGLKRKFSHQESSSNEELLSTCNSRKWKITCRRTIKDDEERWAYNQRGPNFLPLVPGPEEEKVDLKHQTIDEKKNAEEWMLDFAIQQAVTKLAPARKKKVALLVEAFEKVMPVPKYETRSKNSSAAFSHARHIQPCS